MPPATSARLASELLRVPASGVGALIFKCGGSCLVLGSQSAILLDEVGQ